MALVVKIQINTDVIHALSATRVAGGTNEDDINTYDCFDHTDGGNEFIGKVEHRYGDPATELSQKLLSLYISTSAQTKIEDIKAVCGDCGHVWMGSLANRFITEGCMFLGCPSQKEGKKR